MRPLVLLFTLALVSACGADAASGDASGPSPGDGDASAIGGDAIGDGAGGGAEADSATVDAPPPCEPQCEGKTCGDNGCGGLCGTCFGAYTCEEGVCTPCVPQCEGKTCGNDGCGGTCGDCTEPEVCTDSQCGPPPPSRCLEMAPCVMAACVDAGDEMATCITEGTAACGPAVTPVQEAASAALVTCLADNGCSLAEGPDRAECQRIFCLEETVACSQSAEGELECHTILQCLEGDECPKDFMTGEPTIGCIADCLVDGTADAVAKYWELTLCVDAQCLESDYDDMDLCFSEETDTGGACRWPFRDCLMSMF